jgi:hypothetical protein
MRPHELKLKLGTELLVKKCGHKRDYMKETSLFIKEICEKVLK